MLLKQLFGTSAETWEGGFDGGGGWNGYGGASPTDVGEHDVSLKNTLQAPCLRRELQLPSKKKTIFLRNILIIARKIAFLGKPFFLKGNNRVPLRSFEAARHLFDPHGSFQVSCEYWRSAMERSPFSVFSIKVS